MANEFGAMPEFDQAVKNKMQATEDFKLQQSMMNAPTQDDPNQAIMQAGAQSTAAQGQQAVQQQAQGLQDQLKANEQSLADQQFKNQTGQQKSQIQLATQRRQNENRLASMDQDLKNRLVDQQMQFNEDKRGAVMDNEQQMMDYLVAKQATEQEWQTFAREAQQGFAEQQQALDASYNILSQTLQQDNATLIRKYGEESVRRMRYAKEQAEKKKREAAKKGSTFGKILGGAQVAAGIGVLIASGGTGAPAAAGLIGSGVSSLAKS